MSTFHIEVRGTATDNRTVLWERDARHPDGEAIVAGTNTATVGLTKTVTDCIRDGKLEVIDGGGVGPVEVAPVPPVAESWTELDAGGYPAKVTSAAKAESVDHVAEIVPAKYLGDVRAWGLGTLSALAGAELTDLTRIGGVGDKTAEKWIGEAQAKLDDMSQA